MTLSSHPCHVCAGDCGSRPEPTAEERRLSKSNPDLYLRTYWRRFSMWGQTCSMFCWERQRCSCCGGALLAILPENLREEEPHLLRRTGVCSRRCYEVAVWKLIVADTRRALEEDRAKGDILVDITPAMVLRRARSTYHLTVPWTAEFEPTL